MINICRTGRKMSSSKYKKQLLFSCLLLLLKIGSTTSRTWYSQNTEKEDVGLQQYNNEQQEENQMTSENYKMGTEEDGLKDTANQDCSQNETENQYQLVNTNSLLKAGEEFIIKQNRTVDSTILVLGNAGVGKTTFVQFMTGNNSNLISKEVENETGEFTIDDGNKIGISATQSFTLYPESATISVEGQNVSFTDTPGFFDTRNETHEVLNAYVMKKYMKGIDRIKIALLVNYNSLQYGLYKNDFIDLLRNLNTFVNDIDKYKGGIILIATKVHNRYREVNNKQILISDSKTINSIGRYLFQVKLELTTKLKDSIENNKEVSFVNNAIQILNRLLEMNENGDYKNINIFRRPSKSGVLSELKSLQENKISLYNTILGDKSDYIKVSDSDIGYTLSPRARNYLNCLFWYLNENITMSSRGVFETLSAHYRSHLKNDTEMCDLADRFQQTMNKLKDLQHRIRGSKNFTAYVQLLESFIVDDKNNSAAINTKPLRELEEFVNRFQRLADWERILSQLSWAEQMRPLLDYISDEQAWYDFLIKLFKFSITYEIQKEKSKYYNETTSDSNSVLRALLINKNFPLYKNNYFYFESVSSSNDSRSADLDSVVLFAFKRTKITCDEQGVVNVTGGLIRLSELSDEFLMALCNNVSIRTVGIHATHKVFIDANIEGDIFKGVNFIILAPEWEVVGQNRINIDGIVGKKLDKLKAKNGQSNGEKGLDGVPGNPGGNGGNFVGIGMDFINAGNLEIRAIGGRGGPGQNGGDGQIGQPGRAGYEKFYDNPPTYNNYNEIWVKGYEQFPFKVITEGRSKFYPTSGIPLNNVIERNLAEYNHRTEIKIYYHLGECGSIGGSGGNGGMGGFGGHPGKIVLIGQNKRPEILTTTSVGPQGTPGIGGKGGQLGVKGNNWMCFQIYTPTNPSDIGWKCTQFTNTTMDCTNGSGLDGVPNYNTINIVNKAELKTYDFSNNILNYLQTLKHENNAFIIKENKKFRNFIYETLTQVQNDFWHIVTLPLKTD